MKHLKTYRIFESLEDDLTQHIKNVEDILLEFTDTHIPVEVSVRFKVDQLVVSIGVDEYSGPLPTPPPFELNDTLIKTIEEMDDYLYDEGLICDAIYFYKMTTDENGKSSYPESQVMEDAPITEFLKFANKNKGEQTAKLTLGRTLKFKLKYTFIEFYYKKCN